MGIRGLKWEQVNFFKHESEFIRLQNEYFKDEILQFDANLN